MPNSSHDRNGFALVEVIVALTLLTVAVLSLATLGGRLMTVSVAATRRTVATARLTSVTDSLRGTPCRTVSSGSDSTFGVRLTWRVSGGTSTRSMIVTATYSDRTSHTVTTESLIPCD